MTVVLETDMGRFEGETIGEVTRKEKDARRLADRKAAEKAKAVNRAHELAKIEGYRQMATYLQDTKGQAPPAWIYYGIDIATSECGMATDDYGRQTILWVQTDEGKAVLDVWKWDAIGCVINGSGWPVAVLMRDVVNGKEELYAVGACDGELQLVPLPVPLSWYNASKYADQEGATT